MKNKYYSLIVILISFLFCGWGEVGHKIINSNTVTAFPKQMYEFVSWKSVIVEHASDADYRKSSDPTEGTKHFIDIDGYQEFNSTGKIIENLDSIKSVYGSQFVTETGLLPWTIIKTVDSLKAQFARKDWKKAQLTCADLGHYVGDSHMPLHLTKNYNGQLTGQKGIHSRYESKMVNTYQDSIIFIPDTAKYIQDANKFVFSMIYENYKYVDSLLTADKEASSYAGNTSSDKYYLKLWELTKDFTIKLMDETSTRLASLIYTAWVDAGSPAISVTGIKETKSNLLNFNLYQNYPNPFNPATKIKYLIPKASFVTLKVFDMNGKEVKTLVSRYETDGSHEINFDGSSLASGVYLYALKAGNLKDAKKLVLLR